LRITRWPSHTTTPRTSEKSNTTWLDATERSPGDDIKDAAAAFVGVLLIIYLLPAAVLVGAAAYLLSWWRRASWLWSAGISAVGVLVIQLEGPWSFLAGQWDDHRRVFQRPTHRHGHPTPSHPHIGAFGHLIWTNLPAGLAVGGAAAAGMVFWRLRERRKERTRTRPTFIAWMRLRRNTRRVAIGRGAPTRAIDLGVNPMTGQRVAIEEIRISSHVLIPGGSGAGKTVSAMRLLHDGIRNGSPAVVVDLKASPTVATELEALAAHYNRPFYRWSLNGPTYYDPLGSGDATRRRDLAIESMSFTEPLYKAIAQDYLHLAFDVMDLVRPADPARSTLADLVGVLSPRAMQARIAPYADQLPDQWRRIQAITADAEATQRSGIRGLAARLSTIVHSVAGPWLGTPPEGGVVLDLRRALQECAIVYFELDSATYEGLAATVAGLVIQDLKTLSGEMRRANNVNPAYVFIDEFAAVESTNVLGLLNKARDSLMPVTLATQSLADLARQEPTFIDQVLDIVGSFAVHRTNSFDHAERLALLAGERAGRRIAITHHRRRPWSIPTVSRTQEDVAVRRLTGSDVQSLPRGHMFLIDKHQPPENAVTEVRVIRVNLADYEAPSQPLRPVSIWQASQRAEAIGIEVVAVPGVTSHRATAGSTASPDDRDALPEDFLRPLTAPAEVDPAVSMREDEQ
jgi:hypothetical protein